MSKIKINYKGQSNKGLLTQRSIDVGDTTINTPASAMPARRVNNDDPISEEAQKICEVSRGFDLTNLAAERQHRDASLSRELMTQANKTDKDNVVFTILRYTDTAKFSKRETKQLIDLQTRYGDVASVPLMSEIRKEVDSDGADSARSPFTIYYQNAKRVLEVADEKDASIPILGVVPPLDQKYVLKLIELYDKHGVDGLCINFDGGRPTADAKIDLLKTVMEQLGQRRNYRNTFVYGINVDRRPLSDGQQWGVADDVIGYALGLDILGGYYVPVSAPPEVFEQEDDEKDAFEYFHRKHRSYRKCSIENLPQVFPDDSSFDPVAITEECRDDDEQRGRYERLVTNEQIALFAAELREENPETILESFKTAPRTFTDVDQTSRRIREALEDGQSQSSLNDFSD